MSFFQMAYVAYYVHKKSKEQKKVDLGGGITYYLRLHKNNSEANNLNTFSKGNKKNRASYYYTGW